ncbi:hypothetical protein EPA93_40385 [Ktedonosporobacter rubrisoli]|uniref:non-specific serine/threonine protein kinase n=1 Tax=Ktedonosporobacter rubrisoli TaxID=2509675 RepID=A0A4P6K236_KTERU|nr:protein kinase [Ktedonosporobacter rubrisoli]QBD81903.1 hypothetical protein EPA93_40385 [Ktedonosporobacter rubrisoli]
MQTMFAERLVGKTLGNYSVERLLGQGRVNAVYLVRHLASQSSVALTLFLIPEQLSQEARARFIQRFRQGAAALVALRHPHILPVHEYDEHSGYPYLITPYMTSGSLADSLKKQGRCRHEDVLAILEQIAAGLEHAHSKGVMHGILRPSNIVLGEQETMLVAGFELLHLLQIRGIESNDQPYAHLFSIANTFLAAPEYVAPEVVEGQVVDARSDIYALGIILFELLTGQTPFTGSNPLEVAKMHLKYSSPSIRSLCPDIPMGLASVINQALERDPARRFQQVSELVEAFAQVSRGATGVARAVAKNGAPASDGLPADGPRDTGIIRRSPRGSWQLRPPIVTGKLPSVEGAKTKTNIQPAAQVTDAWQFVPPIMTGQLPSVPPSTSAHLRAIKSFDTPTIPPQVPADLASGKAKLAAAEASSAQQADDWWLFPSQPQELAPDASQPKRSRLAPASSRATSRKQKSSLNRRQAMALLVSGGVLAAGTAVVINKNLVQMVENVLHVPGAAANTGAATMADKGKMQAAAANPGKQQMTTGQGHVIGHTNMQPNTALDFTNPADQQPSMLIHLPGKFTAYEKACTHENVIVHYDPAKQQIICPKHGAIFDPANKGAVLRGPATKPLPQVAIHVNPDGTITV